MYHPAKIIRVFAYSDKNTISAENTTQALVEMWDENIFTLLVEPRIAGDIKEGDIVLVDYTPILNSMQPRHVIIKILKNEPAKTTWERYKKYNESRKKQEPKKLQRKVEIEQEDIGGYMS